MELRERRSLTYGAYSRLYEKVKVAPLTAESAVRTQATAEAMSAMVQQLEEIVSHPAPTEELEDAKRFLVDSFPLTIDTSEKIVGMVADLRIFGLPDAYWDSYRSKIAAVKADQAREAVSRYLRPSQALIVVVGRAAEVKTALTAYGPVTVVDTQGEAIPQSGPSDATQQKGDIRK
jgi:predicted Zn-dependent peptidase